MTVEIDQMKAFLGEFSAASERYAELSYQVRLAEIELGDIKEQYNLAKDHHIALVAREHPDDFGDALNGKLAVHRNAAVSELLMPDKFPFDGEKWELNAIPSAVEKRLANLDMERRKAWGEMESAKMQFFIAMASVAGTRTQPSPGQQFRMADEAIGRANESQATEVLLDNLFQGSV